MSRQYTEQELQAVMQAEQQLRARGLMVDDSDGQEAVNVNSERISAYFELNKNLPLTVQTILAACEQMRGQMMWKSAAQVAYDSAYQSFSAADQAAFEAWWRSQSRILDLEGENGFSNASKILGWMKNKTMSARGLDLAVSNLAGTSGLFWAPQREQSPQGKPGHEPSGSFAPKSDSNLSLRDHMKRAKEAAAKASGNHEQTPGTDYQYEAERIVGRNHAHTEQLRKFFVTEAGNINWEQTYGARRRAAGL